VIPSEAIVDRALEHDLVTTLLRTWLRAERDVVAKVDRLHRALALDGVGPVPDPERREARLKAATRAKVEGRFGEWYLTDAGVAHAERLLVREYDSRDQLVGHLAAEAREMGIDDDYGDEHLASAVARTHFETDLSELVDLVVGFDEGEALRSCLVDGLRRADRGLEEALAALETDGSSVGVGDSGEGGEN